MGIGKGSGAGRDGVPAKSVGGRWIPATCAIVVVRSTRDGFTPSSAVVDAGMTACLGTGREGNRGDLEGVGRPGGCGSPRVKHISGLQIERAEVRGIRGRPETEGQRERPCVIDRRVGQRHKLANRDAASPPWSLFAP